MPARITLGRHHSIMTLGDFIDDMWAGISAPDATLTPALPDIPIDPALATITEQSVSFWDRIASAAPAFEKIGNVGLKVLDTYLKLENTNKAKAAQTGAVRLADGSVRLPNGQIVPAAAANSRAQDLMSSAAPFAIGAAAVLGFILLSRKR
jgi:hypothetical protein